MKPDTKAHMARFYWKEMSGIGKSTGDKGILVISWGKGRGEWEVTATGYCIAFLRWWKYSGIRHCNGHNTLWIIKNHWIVHINRVNFMVYQLYFN